VEPGETSIDAAVRELKEETGIDLTGEEELSSLIPPHDAQPINSYVVGKGAGKKTVRSPLNCYLLFIIHFNSNYLFIYL
jgi:8-oxo-dGTP pyrophosphatase MutT (NUDIX family)